MTLRSGFSDLLNASFSVISMHLDWGWTRFPTAPEWRSWHGRKPPWVPRRRNESTACTPTLRRQRPAGARSSGPHRHIRTFATAPLRAHPAGSPPSRLLVHLWIQSCTAGMALRGGAAPEALDTLRGTSHPADNGHRARNAWRASAPPG